MPRGTSGSQKSTKFEPFWLLAPPGGDLGPPGVLCGPLLGPSWGSFLDSWSLLGLISGLLGPTGAHFWPAATSWGSSLASWGLPGGHFWPPGGILELFRSHFGLLDPPPEVFCEPSRRPVRRLRAPRHTIENTVRNHSPKDLSRPLHARSAPGRWLGGRFGGASPTGDPVIGS